MRTVLADHNIEGQAERLWGILGKEGWLSLLSLELVTFQEVALFLESSDREVWRFAQTHQMVLLTANRNMEGEHSLEQTLREENTITSLPILTLSNPQRFSSEKIYREQCAERLVEVLLDLENYLGAGRIFLP